MVKRIFKEDDTSLLLPFSNNLIPILDIRD